jgi:hypothetical protein
MWVRSLYVPCISRVLFSFVLNGKKNAIEISFVLRGFGLKEMSDVRK